MGRRITILLLLVLIVSLLVWWLSLGEAGPRFKGQAAREWLIQYGQCAAPGPMRDEASEAIRYLGTNIIPQVIDALLYVETRAHAVNVARFNSLFLFLGTDGWIVDDESYRLEGAMKALPLLGADARWALPQLARLLESPGASVGGTRAATILANLGPLGRPILVQALGSKDPYVRLRAATCMDVDESDEPRIVDALFKTVEDGDTYLVRASVHKLSRMKLDPARAIPVFQNLVTNTVLERRYLGIVKLAEFGPEARVAVPELLKSASDPDGYISQISVNALQLIAPEVLTNFPDAHHMLSSPDQWLPLGPVSR
jgi:HEAT repeat protein